MGNPAFFILQNSPFLQIFSSKIHHFSPLKGPQKRPGAAPDPRGAAGEPAAHAATGAAPWRCRGLEEVPADTAGATRSWWWAQRFLFSISYMGYIILPN